MSTTEGNGKELIGSDGPLCSKCSRPTNPIYSGQAVYFQCENGHQLAVGEIIKSESEAFDAALDLLIQKKQGSLEQIIRMIRDAEARGHFQVAAVLRRQVEPMETRLLTLRAVQPSKGRPARPGGVP